MSSNPLKAEMALMLFIILSGCNPYPPLDPTVQLPSDYTYIIGPGDSIEMFVWGNPEISRSFAVRPDGKISAPLIEELPATGKTPYQLARDIEKELSKYIRNPLVSVIVSGFVGPYTEQIRIVGNGLGGGGGGGFGGGGGGFGGGGGGFGGGGRAMSFTYREHMTLLDLVIQVGSFGRFAAGNRASLVRYVNGERLQFGLRLDDLVRDGDITANVELLPGDIIFIPETWF